MSLINSKQQNGIPVLWTKCLKSRQGTVAIPTNKRMQITRNKLKQYPYVSTNSETKVKGENQSRTPDSNLHGMG